MHECALLLVGSPKGPQSTSNSLGEYLLKRLEERGFESEKIYIYDFLKSDTYDTSLLKSIDNANILILTFPLYFDSLPSKVIAMLELISEHHSTLKEYKKQRFLSISNSGFPEASQSGTAHAICLKFASEIKIEWIGGLALGSGGAIGGRNLDEAGRMAGNVRKALELTANTIANNKLIPNEVIKQMGKPIVSPQIFTWFGDTAWKKLAKENGIQDHLYDRPYQIEEDSSTKPDANITNTR
jgi:multimeric flavodoxin WrbA